ncbi:GNAT family N-acetyltransferase [Streptomyces sp. MI02-7b]|uniref:GNAT family N-acetyltransferase n=1 Tax=Streptomyces sp. MI02-7b TaxID=462941 RepID=UPI0029B77D62|nr:GNAT family N-acetyltransferase [Streptomyces sp. MI02-7b]MDX3076395.1 GNAT family N-acetyltransferase [Streptomyces sp. MI02-7b]
MTSPLPPLPVRRLGPGDLAACSELAVSRDWGAEERKWRFLLTHGTGWGIDAPDGRGLAATTVLTRYAGGLAAVSMVLVAARYEGRGVGRRIMTHVLGEAGDDTVTLHATDRGRPLYEKLGFRTVGTVVTHRGGFRPPAADEPDPAAPRPAGEADLPALLALDAEVFGADRSPLLRDLPRFAERTLVTEEDGRLTGYASAWRNDGTLVLGPIVADTTAAARRLVTAIARDAEGPVRLDLRTEDPLRHTLPAWAAAHGVLPAFPNTLMVLGDRNLPGDDARRHTPLMLALG